STRGEGARALDDRLGLVGPGRPRPLHGFGRDRLEGGFRRRLDARREGAHVRVPPTVMAVNRTVGCPTPTGFHCPSLPHDPVVPSIRRSLATASILSIASLPLPVSVALRTGWVSLPFSIWWASVTWNEKLESAGLTERPPRFFQ